MAERCPIRDLDAALRELPGCEPVTRAHLLRYLSVPPGAGPALDACCGTGYGAEILRRLGYGPVDAFDRTLAPGVRRRYPGVRFFRETVEAFAPARDRYALAACFEALEHLDDPRSAARKIFGSLRPGGRLVASVPIDHPDRVWHKHVFDAAAADALFASLPGRTARHSLPCGVRVWEVVR